MKKIIFCITLLLTVNVYSQTKSSFEDILSKANLKGPADLPDSLRIYVLVEQILNSYGKSFDYYDELKSGHYSFTVEGQRGSGYTIVIHRKSKEPIKIKVNKQLSPLGGYILSLDLNDVKKLVKSEKNIGFKNRLMGGVSIIERNNILADQNILPSEDLDPEVQKILDKDFTTTYLVDQNDKSTELYKLCQTGIVFPYSGANSKMLTLDNEYSSIFYSDGASEGTTEDPLNKCYGYYGDDPGEFMNPMGMCVGRMYVNGDYDTYPIYIADMYNLRIQKVNYLADHTFSKRGSFDAPTFKSIALSKYPYDICYFKYNSDSTEDKLWVTEVHPLQNYLTCFDIAGVEIQHFTGYKDINTSETYTFDSNTLSRIGVYNDGFAALCFIDNTRNCLVSCPLNEDGTAADVEHIDDRNDYIVASDVLVFPKGENIHSVSFQKTPLGSSDWPSVWVTSDSYVHHIKMNKSVRTQYLASTSLPRNSLESFTNMRNTICTPGVYDIYTIESWSSTRGFRKYYPFCDIHSETLENYCADSLDLMKFKATFTNDCWLYITAERKNRSGSWETVKIKEFNGTSVDTTFYIKWQYGGWNQNSEDLYINLKLDLPIEDYVLGDSVSVSMRIYPEYLNPVSYYNSDHIKKDYKAFVQKTCLPLPGGCPFVYVNNENGDFQADNNILPKSEYSSGDITDKYKLQITPRIIGDSINLAIIENESDNDYINMVKLYAVDYPSDRRMAVTDGNTIVIYNSETVTVSDSAMKNATNVTSNLNFFSPSSTLTNGVRTDSLYAHFTYSSMFSKTKGFIPNKAKNNDKDIKTKKIEQKAQSEDGITGPGTPPPNWAFIGDIGNLIHPNTYAKDTGGVLTANSIYSNSVTQMFARREKNSVVVLPLFGDSNKVSNFKIKWQDDYRIKYIGIANLEYTGFNVNEIPISKASYVTATLDSGITTSISAVDTLYGGVSSTSLIKMKFDLSGVASIPSHWVRSYVIQVNGHYTTGSDNPLVDNHNGQVPLVYKLSQNYPNPFNPTTKISYEIPKDTRVKLIIYDILGREVKKLVDNDFKQAGRYIVDFDGTNLASGVYFYHIEAGTFIESKKMVLLK